MPPSPQYQRALLLIDQSRYEMAEQELRHCLATDPNHAEAHAMLALCFGNQEKYVEATDEAQLAIHLEPDNPFSHYIHGWVLVCRNRFPEALEAVKESIRLEPAAADAHALLAAIYLEMRRWGDALLASETGLALQPDHVRCINLRAKSLVKLGRKSDAKEAIQSALQRAPEDSDTHANMGWTELEQGQTEEALEHFREALRLDPNNDLARGGIVEALKARYFIYRIMLGYFLWMMKLSRQAQWGIMIGAYVLFQVLKGVAANNPTLAPWIWPLLFVYIGFVVMTWISQPLFNLLLRLNRFGRFALSREETLTSNWIGSFLAGAMLCLVMFFLIGNALFLFAALVFGLTIPSLTRVYHCHPGWPRITMVLITVSVATMGFTNIVVDLLRTDKTNVILGSLWLFSFFSFFILAIGSQFAANALGSVRPRV